MKFPRTVKHFEDVQELVSQKFPKFRKYRLKIGCSEIERKRQIEPDPIERNRAYMHLSHYPKMICVYELAEKLPSRNLYGLFLHEFGHAIQKKYHKDEESNQMEADITILNNFGISINYDEKELQYIELNKIYD